MCTHQKDVLPPEDFREDNQEVDYPFNGFAFSHCVLDSTLPTYLCSPKIAQDQFHCSCKDLQMF